MPTSSQALILKNTDGLLYPVFGRPYWRPTSSWIDPFTRNDSIQNSFLSSKHPRRKQSPQRRAESTKTTRLDFSELHELLKINGIHGSFIYNVNSNSLRLAFPTYQQSAFKQNYNHWNIVPSSGNIGRAGEFCTGIHRKKAGIDFNPDASLAEMLLDPKPGFNSNKHAPVRAQEMVKLQVNNAGQLELTQAPAPEADYFRLVQETEDGVFRLIKSDANDARSFRLESIKPADIGDYCLVPKDGFESDDFRLVTLDAKNRLFRLLQADTAGGKTFHSVTMTAQTDGEFRLIQAAPREKFTSTYRNNSLPDTNAGTYETSSAEAFEVENTNNLPYTHSKYMYAPSNGLQNTENAEQNFVLPKGSESSASSFLPDITLYDSKNLTTKHRLRKLPNDNTVTQRIYTKPNEEMYMHVLKTTSTENTDAPTQQLQADDNKHEFPLDKKVGITNMGKPKLQLGHEKAECVRKLSWSSAENDMDAFREKYIESYRDASPEMYGRLVSLGFRAATEHSVSNKSTENKFMADLGTPDGFRSSINSPVIMNKCHDIEWRTQNVKPWSHSTSGFTRADFSSALSANEMTKLRSNQARKASLIDEVKLKANYKAWKKKKITALRMRKELPLKDPNAVCVTFRDNAISHERLKQIVEKSAGSSLTSLQFDPVSVHSIDADAKSQWIFRFEDSTVCKRLVETGLWIDGELLSVRKYDDVMKDEHEAYQYYLVLNEYRKIKQAKASAKDRKPKSTQRHDRKLTDSHTQTAGGTTLSQ